MKGKILDRSPSSRAARWFVINLVWICLLIPRTAIGEGAEKITIGEIEDIVLLKWGVKYSARIDTGATSSSLDARKIKIKNDIVNFELRGGKQLEVPLLEYRRVRTSVGKERRPVVLLDICLGSLHLLTQVTLTNRSHLKYALLIGRRVLKGYFVVDVSRRNTTRPSCPELRFK